MNLPNKLTLLRVFMIPLCLGLWALQCAKVCGGIVTMAQYMEEVLVSQCPNIKLILCGHARGIARQTFVYDDDGDEVPDRTVNVLMYDVQEDRKKYGYLCLLTYDPATNSLFVDSYSPFLDDYIYNDDDVDTERFTIKNVF